jgi:hypothetical protein
MDYLSDSGYELQSPVYLLEAERVVYQKVSTASCKVIDLGRRIPITSRNQTIETTFEEVLSHLGMAPVEKRQAWYDHIRRHPKAIPAPNRSRPYLHL